MNVLYEEKGWGRGVKKAEGMGVLLLRDEGATEYALQFIPTR